MGYKLYDYQKKLVIQARKSIANGSKGVLIQAPPGSGKSVVIAEIARLATDKENHVLFVVHRKELAEQIEESFIKHKVNMEHVTIQTILKAYNRRNTMPTPDVIITDETHHSRAKTYQRLYEHFSQAFRLGFTATPWRMSGRGFTDIYDEMVQGPSVEWLIENHALAPYRYFAESSIDRKHLKQNSMGEYDNKSIEKEFSSSRIYGEIVRHYQEHALGRKTIVYAPSVNISEQIASEFQSEGIKAKHVDGKTPQKERDTIMNDFRESKIDVIVNVDLISEGFNVPDCSCVILARPTKSLVLFIQQAMRSMRYQPGKEAIILDHVGNVHEFGLPDAKRDWTIKDLAKKSSGKSEPSLAKQCPTCASWLSPETKFCPHCEYEFGEERTVDFEDGELEEITNKEQFKKEFALEQFKFQHTKKPIEQLKTVKEKYFYVRAKGWNVQAMRYHVPALKNAPHWKLHQELSSFKEEYDTLLKNIT